jgi:hypothetical protein
MKFNPVLLAISMCGTFCLYMVGRFRGQTQFSVLAPLNIRINANTKPAVMLLDAILTSALGGFIAYCATEPTTNPQALSTGLAVTGILNSTGVQPRT